MDGLWLLLVYTLPAEPSRKRAAVWREVKKLGALYLRDGVCILPQRGETVAAVETLAAKVLEFEGQATLVTEAHLDAERAEAVVAQLKAARAEEYLEIAAEAERLLEHVRRETEHREFTSAELTELEQDLAKLWHWSNQVAARDYFGSESGDRSRRLLERCDAALVTFLDQVHAHEISRL